MKPPLRIVDTGLRPARWNVAMTAALAELHAAGGASDTVRFHRYPACVLLGAGQLMEQAADAAYCREAGIEIARRVSGGGAVYMSPRMLAWDVLVDRATHGGRLEAVTRTVCDGVGAGLSKLGVEARFRAPNDIAIAESKVAGSSGYLAGRSALLQGTVLVRDDVAAMARALRLPEAVLRQRVTCLEEEIGSAPALPAIVEGIAQGLAEALAREPIPGQIRRDEAALCEALLRDEIGTDAYVAGRGVVPA
jgi:lipoate-protein ligase A